MLKKIMLADLPSVVGEVFPIGSFEGLQSASNQGRAGVSLFIAIAIPPSIILVVALGFAFFDKPAREYHPSTSHWASVNTGPMLITVWVIVSFLIFMFMIRDNQDFQVQKAKLLEATKGKEVVFSKWGLYYSSALFEIEGEFKPDTQVAYCLAEWSDIVKWDVAAHYYTGGTSYTHDLTFTDGSSHSFSRECFRQHEALFLEKLERYLPGRVTISDQIREFPQPLARALFR